MSTPISPAQFRSDFPAFGNALKYPDPLISMWALVAPKLLAEQVWGELFTLGQELFIAHNCVLDGMAGVEAARSGLVGFAKGAVLAESGDKVSVTYSGVAMQPGDGHWSMTTYGQRYRDLVMMVGAGAQQVGPACWGPGFGGGQGWPGVMPQPY